MSELYGQDHGGPKSGKRQGSSGYCNQPEKYT